MKKFYFTLLLLTMALLSSNTFALKRGDTLPTELSAQLQLDPNKISVVDFFASWCVSCRIELPEVSQLALKLNAQAKQSGQVLMVDFIGVQVDEDRKIAAEYLKEINLSFRVIDDASQYVISAFEPIGMPALYYIHNNQVLGIRFGAIPHIADVVSNDLSQLGAL